MTSHAAPIPLLEELRAAGIGYELIEHPRTSTALAEARALGVAPDEVAKTVVLGTSAGLVRAVVRGSDRVDLKKVAETLNVKHVKLLDEHDLAGAYPEFELGAVPPMGGPHGDRVLVDIGVCEQEFVLIEAGTHDRSVRLATRDLVGHETALIADICAD
jgi:Ala-tRNA(Pro) deacylase